MTKDEPEPQRKKSPRQKFLRIPDVAEELEVSERKVWRLIEDEELRAHHFGGSTRIARDDLDDYIFRSRG